MKDKKTTKIVLIVASILLVITASITATQAYFNKDTYAKNPIEYQSGILSVDANICDVTTAKLIKREVSDGVIAPGYEPEALEILKSKRGGNYNIVEIDENYVPAPIEHKQVFGITFEQGRNNFKIDSSLLEDIVTKNKDLPESAKRDLIISLITLKYTQSNSVCFAYDGQAIGVGAGQQ